MQKNIVNTPQPLRLDKWIKLELPNVPHSLISKLLRKGKILVNGEKAEGKTRIQDGDIVSINEKIDVFEKKSPQTYTPTNLELQQFKKLIISERKDFIVINKPSGLASQGGSKLSKHLDGLIQALGKEDGNHYHLVHRLDKETSGVMVIAKNRAAAQNLGAQFKSRDITKIYLAVVQGVPEQQEGKIDLALSKKWSKGFERAAVDEEGDKAVTFYKVIDFIGQSAAYVALMPVTGRNHQLRAHMAAIGCPIVGDKKYNSNSVLMDDLSDRLHLHAYKLILGDMKGSDGYKANLSDDYKKTLKMLGFNVSSKEMDKVVQLLEEQK